MASPSSSRKSVSGSESGSTGRQSTGETIPDALSVEEHGRQWNAYREGKYLLPNDGDEQDRLDMQHNMWRLRLGGRLYLAPVGHPSQVLDIGTGTGIWALQFAAEHPTSNVIGTDISMIQPRHNLPPNCLFIREDSEEEWIFDIKFDFIHWRLMVSCFHDHKEMLQKVYDNLVPGGWAEFQEWSCEFLGADGRAEENLQASVLGRFIETLIAGGAATGRDFRAPRKYKRWMTELGF
ncbi:S-adenosyl-L-methionine-dependent methyltransferase, partial [Cryphonectria parasitica EP155]